MGLTKYYSNSKVTNIQIKVAAKTLGEIKACVAHNRHEGAAGTGAHIDKRLSHLNQEPRGTTADEIYCNLASRISGMECDFTKPPAKEELRYADGSKVRKDAALLFELEASYPGDMVWSKLNENGEIVPVENDDELVPELIADKFKMPADKNEFYEWRNAAVDFVKGKYGDENIVAIHVHMDEDEPHIHVLGVPIYTDEKGVNRLSAKHFIGNRGDLAQLQTDYAEAVAHLGYKRGQEFSSRISDISTKEYKARLNMALSEEIPDTLEACQEEILNLRAKNFDLDREIRQTVGNAKTVQNVRKKNYDIKKENDLLRQEIERVSKERDEAFRKLQFFIDRDIAGYYGKKYMSEVSLADAEVVNNVEMCLKQIYEKGIQELEKMGYHINSAFSSEHYYSDDLDNIEHEGDIQFE